MPLSSKRAGAKKEELIPGQKQARLCRAVRRASEGTTLQGHLGILNKSQNVCGERQRGRVLDDAGVDKRASAMAFRNEK